MGRNYNRFSSERNPTNNQNNRSLHRKNDRNSLKIQVRRSRSPYSKNPTTSRNRRTTPVRKVFIKKSVRHPARYERSISPILSRENPFRNSKQLTRDERFPEKALNDGFTVSIKVGDKSLNASVNSHRRVSVINRSVFKLLGWNVCPANLEIVNIPMSAGRRTLEILCVTNYQSNVPVILGREAINQFGFKLSICNSPRAEENIKNLEEIREASE